MLTRNYVQLIGNLGRDPEIIATAKGSQFAVLSVATSERWKDSAGEFQTRTHWHRVAVFAPALVEAIKEHYAKGKRVFVEGFLRTREYEKDGAKHYATEILVQGYTGIVRLVDGKGHKPADGAEKTTISAS